jgi:Zn-dependent peptidase ImmA (M78 family)
VISFKFHNEKIDALSAYSEEKGAFIIVNDDPSVSEERKIFSAVHELGHLIFHRDAYRKDPSELTYSKKRLETDERVADMFASYFLIPRNQLKAYRKSFQSVPRSLTSIHDLKKKFGVSAKAVNYALYQEKYIDHHSYNYYNKRIEELAGANQEPSPISPIEKNKKIRTILRNLFTEEKITTNKVAELLFLDDKEARLLVKRWSDDYLD